MVFPHSNLQLTFHIETEYMVTNWLFDHKVVTLVADKGRDNGSEE